MIHVKSIFRGRSGHTETSSGPNEAKVRFQVTHQPEQQDSALENPETAQQGYREPSKDFRPVHDGIDSSYEFPTKRKRCQGLKKEQKKKKHW